MIDARVNTALMLIDLQEGFVADERTRQAAVRAVQHARDHRQRYVDVIATRFINAADSLYRRELDWHDMGAEHTDTDLVAGVAEVADLVVIKNGYSAVSDTPELLARLRSQHVEHVVIAGVDTDACVLATAFSLFDSDIAVSILMDGCASSGGQQAHENALELMRRNITARLI